MTSTLAADPPVDEPVDTTQAVLKAAATLARRYRITPGWEQRLIPESVALVQAVDAHEQAVAS